MNFCEICRSGRPFRKIWLILGVAYNCDFMYSGYYLATLIASVTKELAYTESQRRSLNIETTEPQGIFIQKLADR